MANEVEQLTEIAPTIDANDVAQSNAEKLSNEKPSSTGGNSNADDLQQKIVKQIEFYFGDINLPRDRFLQEEIKKDEGWVTLETMLKFNRLARLSAEPSVIAAAVKHSELMEVSEDDSKIRRNPKKEIPQNSLEYWQIVKLRTVYVRGFEKDTNLDEILDFMKQYGEVDHVMFRRDKMAQNAFKGSVFVTFKTQSEAEAFAASDVKEFKGKELLKMMQNDYWAKKTKEIKERRLEVRLAKQAKKIANAKEQVNHEAVHFVKGLVLSVENIPEKDCDLMKVKDFFKQFGDVQYVVYENGDQKAQIRFNGEEGGAVEAWKKALSLGDEKVMFGDNELKGTVLEGDDEEAYWNEFSKSKANKQKRIEQNRWSKSHRGGRGRGRGRGAFGGESRGHKRSAERNGNGEDGGEKKSKKTVFEDE